MHAAGTSADCEALVAGVVRVLERAAGAHRVPGIHGHGPGCPTGAGVASVASDKEAAGRVDLEGEADAVRRRVAPRLAVYTG